MKLASFARDRGADVLVVGTCIAAEIGVFVDHPDGSEGALIAFPVAWTLPLLLRRRLPVVASLTPLGALALESQVAYAGTESLAALISVIMAFYTLGRRVERSLAVLAAGLGVVFGAILLAADSGPVRASTVAFLLIVSAAPFLAGLAIREREEEAEELTGRTRRLELEREERALAAVAEERARIARELHDMIGHAISVITVQAGAARMVLDEDPERARQPLRAIERTGQETIAEMRRLIGILRDMGDPGVEPQPGLAQLERLVQSVRDSGLSVELRREGAPAAPVPAAVDLAAYRIVQEALTNALKHGKGEHAVVTVRHEAGSLGLDVESHGAPRRGSRANGLGLTGMRERVALVGGALEAGETDDGGYAVHATLPTTGGPQS